MNDPAFYIALVISIFIAVYMENIFKKNKFSLGKSFVLGVVLGIICALLIAAGLYIDNDEIFINPTWYQVLAFVLLPLFLGGRYVFISYNEHE